MALVLAQGVGAGVGLHPELEAGSSPFEWWPGPAQGGSQIRLAERSTSVRTFVGRASDRDSDLGGVRQRTVEDLK